MSLWVAQPTSESRPPQTEPCAVVCGSDADAQVWLRLGWSVTMYDRLWVMGEAKLYGVREGAEDAAVELMELPRNPPA